MKFVYKYRLNHINITEVKCPKGSKVVLVDNQSGSATVWIEHLGDTTSVEVLKFKIIETGGQVENEDEHVGSYTNGGFVWHIYQVAS